MHFFPQVQTGDIILRQQGQQSVRGIIQGVRVPGRKQILIFADLGGGEHEQKLTAAVFLHLGEGSEIPGGGFDAVHGTALADHMGEVTVFQRDPLVHHGLTHQTGHGAVQIDVGALVLQQRLVLLRGEHPKV